MPITEINGTVYNLANVASVSQVKEKYGPTGTVQYEFNVQMTSVPHPATPVFANRTEADAARTQLIEALR